MMWFVEEFGKEDVWLCEVDGMDLDLFRGDGPFGTRRLEEGLHMLQAVTRINRKDHTSLPRSAHRCQTVELTWVETLCPWRMLRDQSLQI